MKKSALRGFTLIEILIFVAIFSIVIVSFITVLTSVTQIQTRESSAAYVAQESQSLIQQIQYYVQNARLVDMPLDTPTSTLTLSYGGEPYDVYPVKLYLSDGVINFYSYSGPISGINVITSNKVTVSNLSFTRHYNLNGSSSVFGTDSVSFSFTMSSGAAHTSQFYSENFQSSAKVLMPVPKISYVGGEYADADYSPYFMANTDGTGDLTVLTVLTTPTSTITFNDPQRIWTKILDIPFDLSGNDYEFSAFYSLNATSSNIKFQSPESTGDDAFEFKFNGASTSSPFVASSSQFQLNAQNPNSGLAYPTSTGSLLLGILIPDFSTIGITPQEGFTPVGFFSALAHAEFKNKYISGPVSAGWQVSGSAPSSSLSALFIFK